MVPLTGCCDLTGGISLWRRSDWPGTDQRHRLPTSDLLTSIHPPPLLAPRGSIPRHSPMLCPFGPARRRSVMSMVDGRWRLAVVAQRGSQVVVLGLDAALSRHQPPLARQPGRLLPGQPTGVRRQVRRQLPGGRQAVQHRPGHPRLHPHAGVELRCRRGRRHAGPHAVRPGQLPKRQAAVPVYRVEQRRLRRPRAARGAGPQQGERRARAGLVQRAAGSRPTTAPGTTAARGAHRGLPWLSKEGRSHGAPQNLNYRSTAGSRATTCTGPTGSSTARTTATRSARREGACARKFTLFFFFF